MIDSFSKIEETNLTLNQKENVDLFLAKATGYSLSCPLFAKTDELFSVMKKQISFPDKGNNTEKSVHNYLSMSPNEITNLSTEAMVTNEELIQLDNFRDDQSSSTTQIESEIPIELVSAEPIVTNEEPIDSDRFCDNHPSSISQIESEIPIEFVSLSQNIEQPFNQETVHKDDGRLCEQQNFPTLHRSMSLDFLSLNEPSVMRSLSCPVKIFNENIDQSTPSTKKYVDESKLLVLQPKTLLASHGHINVLSKSTKHDSFKDQNMQSMFDLSPKLLPNNEVNQLLSGLNHDHMWCTRSENLLHSVSYPQAAVDAAYSHQNEPNMSDEFYESDPFDDKIVPNLINTINANVASKDGNSAELQRISTENYIGIFQNISTTPPVKSVIKNIKVEFSDCKENPITQEKMQTRDSAKLPSTTTDSTAFESTLEVHSDDDDSVILTPQTTISFDENDDYDLVKMDSDTVSTAPTSSTVDSSKSTRKDSAEQMQNDSGHVEETFEKTEIKTADLDDAYNLDKDSKNLHLNVSEYQLCNEEVETKAQNCSTHDKLDVSTITVKSPTANREDITDSQCLPQDSLQCNESLESKDYVSIDGHCFENIVESKDNLELNEGVESEDNSIIEYFFDSIIAFDPTFQESGVILPQESLAKIPTLLFTNATTEDKTKQSLQSNEAIISQDYGVDDEHVILTQHTSSSLDESNFDLVVPERNDCDLIHRNEVISNVDIHTQPVKIESKDGLESNETDQPEYNSINDYFSDIIEYDPPSQQHCGMSSDESLLKKPAPLFTSEKIENESKDSLHLQCNETVKTLDDYKNEILTQRTSSFDRNCYDLDMDMNLGNHYCDSIQQSELQTEPVNVTQTAATVDSFKSAHSDASESELMQNDESVVNQLHGQDLGHSEDYDSIEHDVFDENEFDPNMDIYYENVDRDLIQQNEVVSNVDVQTAATVDLSESAHSDASESELIQSEETFAQEKPNKSSSLVLANTKKDESLVLPLPETSINVSEVTKTSSSSPQTTFSDSKNRLANILSKFLSKFNFTSTETHKIGLTTSTCDKPFNIEMPAPQKCNIPLNDDCMNVTQLPSFSPNVAASPHKINKEYTSSEYSNVSVAVSEKKRVASVSDVDKDHQTLTPRKRRRPNESVSHLTEQFLPLPKI